jgi:ParB family transcriptional regulator, chromosome partitioning protein
MARKNLLTDLMSELPAGNSVPETSPPRRAPTGEGAIGAVSRSIEQLKQQVAEAAKLSEQIATGQTVVELDPAEIDAAPIADRLGVSGDIEDELLASIRDSGQQVPILVRPHPSKAGRYQVAYGHRRLRACAKLGRSVRVVIRGMSDDELVIAQGSENSARADLTFIERALYAKSLADGGYNRSVIMRALGLDKTAVSKLIAVPERVPAPLIRAIGPAPRIGRDRWLELAGLLATGDSLPKIEDRLTKEEFQNVPSDQRFEMVMRAAAPKAKLAVRMPQQELRDGEGRPVCRFVERPKDIVITINRGAAPGLAEFVRDRMPALFEEFRRSTTQG